MTPVPRISGFPPFHFLAAAPLSTPARPAIAPERSNLFPLLSPLSTPFLSSARHFDSCNWPSAKLPTYGELTLRFCGAAGRAVYQRYCNTRGYVCTAFAVCCARVRPTRPNFTCNFAVVSDPQRGGGRTPRFLIISTRSSRSAGY